MGGQNLELASSDAGIGDGHGGVSAEREHLLPAMMPELENERPAFGADPDTDTGEPFEKQGDFEQYMRNTLNKKDFSASGTSVSSDYFLLITAAEVGNGKVTLYSILHRDGKGNSSVISRSQGTW